MAQAEESYKIAQVRYEESVDILLSVTDAQEKLTQARTNYYTALYVNRPMKILLKSDTDKVITAEKIKPLHKGRGIFL